jgi:ABC-type multidrug transport system fused ATPase/permease subunit
LLWMGAEFISSIGLASVVWMGGTMALSGRLSTGSLVACYSYLAMLLVPVVRMTIIGNYYQEASAGLDRINAILERRPEIADSVPALKLSAVKGKIEFRAVSFAYTAGARTLSDIDLVIPAGSTAAFCGKSGAGKTTLVNLLLRFYEPQQGAVFVDGNDIRGLELKSLRSRMSMVLQDDYLFSGTVKENILYSKPQAAMGEVIAAAKAANADDFISRLAGGYDAQIGEAGVKLSFGQRQRISIARAVLRNPAILILDEATSGVDSETEREIIVDAYRRTMAGRTTLIIAHRLGIVRSADMIVFLADGRIVESGTHEELINRRGYYWKMWIEQNRDVANV